MYQERLKFNRLSPPLSHSYSYQSRKSPVQSSSTNQNKEHEVQLEQMLQIKEKSKYEEDEDCEIDSQLIRLNFQYDYQQSSSSIEESQEDDEGIQNKDKVSSNDKQTLIISRIEVSKIKQNLKSYQKKPFAYAKNKQKFYMSQKEYPENRIKVPQKKEFGT